MHATNLDALDFDQIAEAQGWNADTLVMLLREYIANQHADDALDDFARQKAADENAEPRATWKTGDRVYWTDPGDNLASGFGVITHVAGEGEPDYVQDDDTIISVSLDSGGEAEVLPHELTAEHAATKLVALYVSTAKYGVNGITLHRTNADAYAELADYLTTGNEDDPDYAEDAIPTELEDLMEWCANRADEQGTDWYCTEVEIPPVVPS